LPLAQHPRRAPAAKPDPWWPAEPVRPTVPLEAHSGYDFLSLTEIMPETVGVSVMGLRGKDLERAVISVAGEQAQTGF
jgi:hypothetical protein